MNRLIIIGNGFDLAHGMKTTYRDFILDYVKDCFNMARNRPTRNFTNELFRITKVFDDYNVDAVIDVHQLNFFRVNDDDKFIVSPIDEVREFRWHVIGIFMSELIDQCKDGNWVDIESTYYKHLIKAKQSKELVKTLNSQLDTLTNALHDYIAKQSLLQPIPKYNEIFRSQIYPGEIYDDFAFYGTPLSTMILNFNYTNTPTIYAPDYQNVNIHGVVNDLNNEVIFGYGDENDGYYQELRGLNDNEYLRHMKLSLYNNQNNYKNLLRFTHEPFQVYMMGHSCGLTDRTLLHRIFDNGNCKSIKIFFYEKDGTNNYQTINLDLSRHISSHHMWHEKVVTKPDSIPMPQHE